MKERMNVQNIRNSVNLLKILFQKYGCDHDNAKSSFLFLTREASFILVWKP